MNGLTPRTGTYYTRLEGNERDFTGKDVLYIQCTKNQSKYTKSSMRDRIIRNMCFYANGIPVVGQGTCGTCVCVPIPDYEPYLGRAH